MKKKRILAGVLAAGIAAASVIAFAACKPEETVPAPMLPDGTDAFLAQVLAALA